MNRCVSVYYVLLRSLGISRRVNTRDVRARENKMIRKKERRGKFKKTFRSISHAAERGPVSSHC